MGQLKKKHKEESSSDGLSVHTPMRVIARDIPQKRGILTIDH